MSPARSMLLLAPLVLLSCTTVAEPVHSLSASGTITHGGDPATAEVELTANTYSFSRSFTGSYAVTVGVVPESDCPAATIVARLFDSGGAVVDEQVHDLGACGDHEVDFAFP